MSEHTTTTTGTEWTRESLWQITAEAEDRAYRSGRTFDNLANGRCTACGRKTGDRSLQVHVSIYGSVILPGTEYDANDSQGVWDLGPECAKRVLTPAEIRLVRAANKEGRQ